MAVMTEEIAKEASAIASKVRKVDVLSQPKHLYTHATLAGYFGADCSVSYGKGPKMQLLEGLGYIPNKKGPSVYVYEIPPEFHVK
jgi:hypothetical protein